MFHVDVDALKKIVKDKDFTLEGLASDMGIDRSRLYRHLVGNKLTVNEMHMIVEILSLTKREVEEIFFARKSQKRYS